MNYDERMCIGLLRCNCLNLATHNLENHWNERAKREGGEEKMKQFGKHFKNWSRKARVGGQDRKCSLMLSSADGHEGQARSWNVEHCKKCSQLGWFSAYWTLWLYMFLRCEVQCNRLCPSLYISTCGPKTLFLLTLLFEREMKRMFRTPILGFFSITEALISKRCFSHVRERAVVKFK